MQIPKKNIKISSNLYYMRGKWVSRVTDKARFVSRFDVYEKYENGKLKNFQFSVASLGCLGEILRIMTEEI